MNARDVLPRDAIPSVDDPTFEADYFGAPDGSTGTSGASGTTGRSENGRVLSRCSARRLFAFAWQDDHGRAAFVSL